VLEGATEIGRRHNLSADLTERIALTMTLISLGFPSRDIAPSVDEIMQRSPAELESANPNSPQPQTTGPDS
jgi:hypothetical protein